LSVQMYLMKFIPEALRAHYIWFIKIAFCCFV
jgi:hypothetical protein